MRSDQPGDKSHFGGCGTEVWACHARSECKLAAGGNPQRSCHTARVGRFGAICAAGTIEIAIRNSFKRKSLWDRKIGASEPTVATAGKWRERGTSTDCDGMTIQSVCHLMRIAACASINRRSQDQSLKRDAMNLTNIRLLSPWLIVLVSMNRGEFRSIA